jgi:RimJ/RimL family protein N-acetyltransferase
VTNIAGTPAALYKGSRTRPGFSDRDGHARTVVRLGRGACSVYFAKFGGSVETTMIEGTLVNLRAPEQGDLARDHAWMNDGEVTRFLNRRYPISVAAEDAWLTAQAQAQQSYQNVAFAIDTKDGVHIGNISFHEVRPEDRKARLGIMIGDKGYWSKGYGADAIVTLLRFAFGEMNLHRVDLTVDAENARAIACYHKCGFVEEARLREERYREGGYHDQLIMGILRAEFEAKHGLRADAPAAS